MEAAATTGGGGGGEVRAHGAAHLPVPGGRERRAGGRAGGAAAAGDAYVRVVRAEAARASRVTAEETAADAREASCAASPLPRPVGTVGRRGPSLSRPLAPGTPLTPARRSGSIPPSRAAAGPCPSRAPGDRPRRRRRGGRGLAFGPILQMEKLMGGARTCLVPGPLSEGSSPGLSEWGARVLPAHRRWLRFWRGGRLLGSLRSVPGAVSFRRSRSGGRPGPLGRSGAGRPLLPQRAPERWAGERADWEALLSGPARRALPA